MGGQLDEKTGALLNRLVYKGSTTSRLRGRNIRIKTPVCKALKKINNVEGICKLIYYVIVISSFPFVVCLVHDLENLGTIWHEKM